MSTDTKSIRIRNLNVEVVRKDIKNLHLGVYPPNGRVRVAAPLAVSNQAIRLAVIGKLAWIRRQREKFDNQPRQTAREAVSGESHYLFGRRYRLNIMNTTGRPQVLLPTKTKMELHVPKRASKAERLAVLDKWYRQQLRLAAEPLLEEWQNSLGVRLEFWGVKRMKTRWGSCNHQASRIWLNAELAKKPLACLEYIIVHELLHLIEPTHNDRFIALLDSNLPDWRIRRRTLNSAPLSNEHWTY